MPAATRPGSPPRDVLVSIGHDPATHRAARRLTGAAPPSPSPMLSGLTSRQRSTPTLSRLAGSCDRGHPCAANESRGGLPRSHGPAEGSVNASGVYVRLTPPCVPFPRAWQANALPGQTQPGARDDRRRSGADLGEERAGLNDGGPGASYRGQGTRPGADSRAPGRSHHGGFGDAASRWPALRVAA